jgi:hypothetical protein
MPDPQSAEKALGRWDDEGGAEPDGPQLLAPESLAPTVSGPPSAAEWAEMHTRVIALETLVVALLATGTDAQRALARDMADLITPRPGATPHHLTAHAAHRMGDLIERARRRDTSKG